MQEARTGSTHSRLPYYVRKTQEGDRRVVCTLSGGIPHTVEGRHSKLKCHKYRSFEMCTRKVPQHLPPRNQMVCLYHTSFAYVFYTIQLTSIWYTDMSLITQEPAHLRPPPIMALSLTGGASAAMQISTAPALSAMTTSYSIAKPAASLP